VTDDAGTRAELDVLVSRIEAVIRQKVRGVHTLEWTDDVYEGELMGLSALVRPARAHSGGVVVSAYAGAEVGVVVGPGELRFLAHKRDGIERAAAAAAAAINGGALVEVYRRWWRTSTRITTPPYGRAVATSVWHQEFPGYPRGVHYVQAALLTETGKSGGAITHTPDEVAVGTATAGDQVGARVTITDTGGHWIQWEGPGEHQYNDTYHDVPEMRDVFPEFADQISWEWIDPDFAEWLKAGD
jgi:hypothetical protein